jgi:general stress protein 26
MQKKKMTADQLEAIGQLSDKADNYLHALLLNLRPAIAIDMLKTGLEDLKTEIRKMYFENGGDPDTWKYSDDTYDV